MANSATVVAGQQATAAWANGLRADVLDPTTGHNHDGVGSKFAALGPVEAVLAAGLGPYGGYTNGTFYDGPSLSLGAGTWLVWGQVMPGYANMTIRIVAGVAVVRDAGTTGSSLVSVSVMTRVVLGSTNTVKLSMAANASGTVTLALATLPAASYYGTAQKATYIAAVRVA